MVILLDVVLWLPGKVLWYLLCSVMTTEGDYADDIEAVIEQVAEELKLKEKGV